MILNNISQIKLRKSNMTTFQIVSDLHIEYKNDSVPDPLNYVIPSADVLILAGDIGSLYKLAQFYEFMVKLCRYFEVVLFVPGNHEWYVVPDHEPLSMAELQDRLNNMVRNIDNLYLLNRNSIMINDVCVCGATLWSNPKGRVPPFIVRINGMNTRLYHTMHRKDLAYIKQTMEYCARQKIKLLVVTHHPPTERVLKLTRKRKKFHSLYATNLDYLLDVNKVNTWVCGHVHKNFDFYTDKGCRVVSNQKGKPKDRVRDYSLNFTIDL